MNTLKRTAHKVGVLYFLLMIFGVVDTFVFPGFKVSGDAAATARNILAGEPTYRLGILLGIPSCIVFILLVVGLYYLFKDVDKKHALAMLLFVTLGIAVSTVNMAMRTAPLILLSGADYLSVFSKPQLEALALGFLNLHDSGSTVATAFWGIWLFPFGILVIRSRFIPRIMGIFLIAAGVAYLTSSCVSLVLPEYRQVIGRYMMPLYFGEVPIIFWLLIMGAKERSPQAEPSAAAVRS